MFRYLLNPVLCLLINLASAGAIATSAMTAQPASKTTTFSDYYTVSEVPQVAGQTNGQTAFRKAIQQFNPVSAIEDFVSNEDYFLELKAQVFSLLNLEHHNANFGDTNEPYSRIKHFGTWIHDKRDNDCYNTRAKVLIRESSVPVDFTSTGCTVKSGEWLDPYAGGQYTSASDIQIDHFVPLKNAFVSGAWRWDYKKRCLYANFMGNNFHLLAVLGRENMRKSDSGPDGYMPPSSQYQCQYVEQWLKVKLIWQLGLNPDETVATQKVIAENHCDLSNFKVTVSDLQDQRNFMAQNANLCGK